MWFGFSYGSDNESQFFNDYGPYFYAPNLWCYMLRCPYMAWIQQGHTMVVAGTQILNIKCEVSVAIWNDILLNFEVSMHHRLYVVGLSIIKLEFSLIRRWPLFSHSSMKFWLMVQLDGLDVHKVATFCTKDLNSLEENSLVVGFNLSWPAQSSCVVRAETVLI